MTAQDYPVTTPFGKVSGYPMNNGFHNGIDYGCPMGTPIVVNGVQIGLSNNTGASTGPHLHVGRWVNGQVTDPGVGNGFTFNSAVVTEINEDPTNGKYVRIQGDGASWVYLHLARQDVTVGQVLKKGENDMIPDLAHLDMIFQRFFGRNSIPEEQDAWIGKGSYTQLLDELITQQAYKDQIHFTEVGFDVVNNKSTKLGPGLYLV